MLSETSMIFDDPAHPIDSLETVLDSYNWVYERPEEDYLHLQLNGHNAAYEMSFFWDDTVGGLQIFVTFDLAFASQALTDVYPMLCALNAKMPLGHFELSQETHKPLFRHTILMSPLPETQAKSISQNAVDLSIAQCERIAPAFVMMQNGDTVTPQTLAFLLEDSLGQS